MLIAVLVMFTIVNGYLNTSLPVFNWLMPVYAHYYEQIAIVCVLYRQGVIKKL